MAPRTIRLLRLVRLGAWVAAAIATGGCGVAGTGSPDPIPPSASEPEPTDACLLDTGAADEATELAVAPGGAADSLLVLRHGMLPPVRFDCTGRPRPGLAVSWSADSAGRVWTLELAEARDAAAVSAAWRDSDPARAALRHAGVEAIVDSGARYLLIRLEQPADSLPLVLGDSALALPVPDSQPSVRHTESLSADRRDALDRGAELLTTEDPALLEYARSRPGYRIFPLPWQRTYVLLLSGDWPGLRSAVPDDSAGFRAGLARDAVRSEARSAEGPYWWEDRAGCGQGPQPAATRPVSVEPTVVYDAADPTARALAGRIVALTEQPGLGIRGLPPSELRQALRARRAYAAVLALPSRPLVPCRETADWPAGSVAVPLIETRPSAVVRRGAARLEIDWQGTLRPAASP